MTEFKRPQWAHQKKVFELSKDLPAFALLMAQRTGKTKVTLDTAAYLWEQDKIDAVFILAPNGVHINWTKPILGACEEHLAIPYKAAYWRSSQNNKQLSEVEEVCFGGSERKLRLLSMNYEAFLKRKPIGGQIKELTDGANFVKRFLQKYRVMMVCDESTYIKNPSASKTKLIIAAGEYAPYRRILTGTPGTYFDLFAQFKFLDWRFLGFKTFTEFKNYYGEFQTSYLGRKHLELVKYRHEDELKRRMQQNSFSVKLGDCFDLPPKIFETRYVELSPEQRRIYDKLAEDYVAQVTSEYAIFSPLAITRQTRLRQISGGHVQVTRLSKSIFNLNDADTELQILPCPKVDEVLKISEEFPGKKMIIWAWFVPEILRIEKALSDKYGKDSVVVYRRDSKQEAEERFQRGNARFIVGQPHSGGFGIDLSAAEVVVRFSNSFSYIDHDQSEERAQHAMKKVPTAYIDLVAPDTTDERILEALKLKKDIAEYLRERGETYFMKGK